MTTTRHPTSLHLYQNILPEELIQLFNFVYLVRSFVRAPVRPFRPTASAMTSTLSYYIHPYAQQIALHALQRINGARLKFILQYKEPPEEIQVGETGSEKSDSTVELRVRSPNVWMRICSCFDLVRHHILVICIVYMLMRFLGLCRGLYVPRSRL